MTYWTFKNDSVKIEFRYCHFSVQNPPWFSMVNTIKDQTLKLDCRSLYAVVPKLCPHFPLGHLCPLPSCHIDLIFSRTHQSGPAFGLYSLWLECSSPDSHMLCFLTSFRSLTRITCLLTNASKNFSWLLLSKEINMSKYFFTPPLGISDYFIIHSYMELFPSFLFPFMFTLPLCAQIKPSWMSQREIDCCISLFPWLTYMLTMFYKEEKSSQSSLNIRSLIDEAQLSVEKHQQFSSRPPNIFHHGQMESHELKLPSLYLMGPQRQMVLLFPNLFTFSLQNSFLPFFGFIVLHSFELYVTLSRLSFIRAFISAWDEYNCLSFPIPNLWEEKNIWIIFN